MRDSLVRRNKEVSGLHLLSPANDWWAGYRDDDGSLYFRPLAVWAYVNVEYRKPGPGAERNQIIGITGVAVGQLDIRDASDNPEFIGYFRSDQFNNVGVALKREFVPEEDA